MGLEIIALVLVSATLHPIWNMLVKKNTDPQLSFFFVTLTLCLSGLFHGILTGADFSAALTVWPLIAMSICGQLLYGTSLTATLMRGDLSAYYPIIRASPVFIITVSWLFLGISYSLGILLGVAMVLVGGFALLYRRGTNFLDDPRTLGFAILAMSGTGIYSLADARLMQTIEPPVLLFFVEVLLVPIYAIRSYRNGAFAAVKQTPVTVSFMFNLLLPGVLCYASYYLILLAYEWGGDVAAVTSVRQASIPISVALGGMFLREGAMARRFFAAGFLALGIVVIALVG